MFPLLKWKDRAVEFPRRFREVDAGGGLFDHIKEPGHIISEGTPYNAENMNRMENGIYAANFLSAMLAQAYGIEIPALQKLTQEEFGAEVQVVTLNNSERQPFNSSEKTVSLLTERNTMNYTVEVEIMGGTQNVGTVQVYDKQLNGFKISYDGSAESAKLRLIIKGGMQA